MKVLYLDCSMGAAGDMLGASLLELIDDRQAFLDRMNALGLPGVSMRAMHAEKCSIGGTHLQVLVGGVEEGDETQTHHYDHDQEHQQDHDHEHHHGHHHGHGTTGLKEIRHLVENHLDLDPEVKRDILAVYDSIAEAESRVHGEDMEHIHFHEVGSMDAIADVTAACLLIHELKPDKIVASPIHVGSGTVKCAHGILPVPAPATAQILKGVPCYSSEIKGELCTPTGAALVKHFADSYGPCPAMVIEKIGYGLGKKDFPRANFVRTFFGEYTEADGARDSIWNLSCNLDDMTAEEIGFAMDRLYEAGALEAFTIPVGTKKNRPGVLLQVLCREERRMHVVGTLFRHTSTIGIREQKMNRYVLDRTIAETQTPFGAVRRKDCSGYGVSKRKYEFDDLADLAITTGQSLTEIREEILRKEGD